MKEPRLSSRVAFDVALFLLFAAAWYGSRNYLQVATYFPVFASIGGMLFSAGALVVDVRRARRADHLEAASVAPTKPSTGEPPRTGADVGPAETHADAAPLVRGMAEEDTAAWDEEHDLVDAASGFGDYVRQVAWLGGTLVLVRVVGIYIAAAVYLTTFLRIEAKASVRFIVLANVAVFGVLYLMGNVLNLRWPANLLSL